MESDQEENDFDENDEEEYFYESDDEDKSAQANDEQTLFLSPDKDGNTSLHLACYEMNQNLSKEIINRSNGVNIDLKNKAGYTSLHLACQADGMLETVHSLIFDGNADLQARGPGGNTALHLASMNDCLPIAQFLVSIGADINKPNDKGHNALHVACISGHIETVKWFLGQEGIQTRMQFMVLTLLEENSLLHLACYHGHIALVEYLVNVGHELNGLNKDGKSPLHLVCEKAEGNLDQMALYLLPRYPLEERGHLLHWARRKSNWRMASFILKPMFRVPVDARDKDGNSCLHLACQEGQLEAVMFFLNHGANIAAMNTNGLTPLHLACLHDHDALVTFLLSRGVNVDIQTNTGQTPLHLSICTTGRKAIIQILLAAGANINVGDNRGNTPLHHTLLKATHEDSLLLLELKPNERRPGVDVNARNNEGDTPLHIACQCSDVMVSRLLNDWGALFVANNALDTPFHVACKSGARAAAIKLLQSQGTNIIHLRNGSGNTPLHEATIAGHSQILTTLIDLGAQVDDQNHAGNTSLHLACQSRPTRSSLFEILLFSSGNPFIQNSENKIPLELVDFDAPVKLGEILELYFRRATNLNLLDSFEQFLPLLYGEVLERLHLPVYPELSRWHLIALLVGYDTNFMLDLRLLPRDPPDEVQRSLSIRDRRAWSQFIETTTLDLMNPKAARCFVIEALVRFIAEYL